MGLSNFARGFIVSHANNKISKTANAVIAWLPIQREDNEIHLNRRQSTRNNTTMYRDAKAQQTFPSTNAPLKQQLGILSYWHVILGLFSILVGVAGPMAMHRLQLAASDSKPYLTFTEFYPFYLCVPRAALSCTRIVVVSSLGAGRSTRTRPARGCTLLELA
jgi:hypothetical protein